MERIEVNVQTGEQRTIALTEAEIAEIQARPQPEPPTPPTPADKLARTAWARLMAVCSKTGTAYRHYR
jgi:hypothetical protein